MARKFANDVWGNFYPLPIKMGIQNRWLKVEEKNCSKLIEMTRKRDEKGFWNFDPLPCIVGVSKIWRDILGK